MATADHDVRAGAADRAVLQRRLARPGRRRRSPTPGTSATAAPRPRPTRRTPTPPPGNYTAQLTVTDTGGPHRRSRTCRSRSGNTAPTVTHHVAAGRRLLRLGRPGQVHGHGHRPGGRHDRLHPGARAGDPRPRRARPPAGPVHRLHRHRADLARQSGHGADANIFAVLRGHLHRQRRRRRRRPADRPVACDQLQPKRKQAEYFTATGRVPDGAGGGDPGVQAGDDRRHRGRLPEHRLHRGRRLLVVRPGQPRPASTRSGSGRRPPALAAAIEVRAGSADRHAARHARRSRAPAAGRPTTTSRPRWPTSRPRPGRCSSWCAGRPAAARPAACSTSTGWTSSAAASPTTSVHW